MNDAVHLFIFIFQTKINFIFSLLFKL